MMCIRTMDREGEAGAILDLWTRSMGRDFPLDERLLRQQFALETAESLLLGAFDPTEPGRPVGAILAKRSARRGADGRIPSTGYISFVAVDPDRRRRGIGSSLLARAEEWLVAGCRAGGIGTLKGAEAGIAARTGTADGAMSDGGMEVRFGADTWHFFPGIPEGDSFAPARAFAIARGFSPGGLEHDVAADLERVDPFGPGTGASRVPGYRATAFGNGKRREVEEFFARAFPGRWRHDVERMIDCGMRGEDLLLLEEEASGRVLGFANLFSPQSAIYGPGLYWRSLMGESPGGLGPIGVDDAARGKGLGLYLLAEGLAELKSRGCRFTVIDWTDLVSFYAKFGFGIWKSYRMHSKRLAPSASGDGNRDSPRA